ncbi:hypothetical protein QYE76_020075 [Lolium multiflorum]|uniref:Lysosomal Pro-X carboxypeptidase n=1 Tax=Lolium multiflorum TaxID=4521 RepID=A0AAD8R458_LOLMU|nr:hypothetical protein QYE76_020075 [Lolium multiflorum]
MIPTTAIVASPMALIPRLCILLLVAMTATTGASEDRAKFSETMCYRPPTSTADGGSTFHGKDLSSAAEPTGFTSLHTAGRAFFDCASVRGLCFLSDAGKKIAEQCGDASHRSGFFNESRFQSYADGANSSSSGADDNFRAVFFSGDAVPSPDIVSVKRLMTLAHFRSPQATPEATSPASKGGATTVHVLAQWARDEATVDRVGCLRPAASVWGISALEGRVAAVLGSRCYLRFDISTPPVPLQDKIRRMVMDNLVVTVIIGLVAGALIVDRGTIKVRKNRNAAAAARGRCRAPFAAMLALLAVARLEGTAAYGYTTHYFPQELDHFSFTPASSTVFYQRYLVNDSFWARSPADDKVAGPIFVYTGNESPVEVFVDNTGFMFDIAPKFGALLVFIEHRYYGESLPFGNRSYESPEKLGYLTSTQALADYALLITSLKRNLSAVDSPVVVFGGSYGGMLAGWFRLKYPHVAIGALAASAPVLMFDQITPWTSFYDALSQDYMSESLNCFSVIKGAWDVIYERGSSEKGLLELSKTFRACSTVPSAGMFVTWLEDAFKFTTLFDYPIPVKFVKSLPAYPVKQMCKIIDGFSGGADVVQKVVAAASLYYNDTGIQDCFDIGKAGDPLGPVFQWQACTEMVLPMTSSNYSMFPPFEFSYQNKSANCLSKYKVKPRPHWITAEFGGNKIERVLKRFGSNIIFSNGLRDPLSRGGVLKNISTSIVALVTEKGAHHFDLRGANPDDPGWVVEQRRQEAQIIQGWIDQYYDDNE